MSTFPTWRCEETDAVLRYALALHSNSRRVTEIGVWPSCEAGSILCVLCVAALADPRRLASGCATRPTIRDIGERRNGSVRRGPRGWLRRHQPSNAASWRMLLQKSFLGYER